MAPLEQAALSGKGEDTVASSVTRLGPEAVLTHGGSELASALPKAGAPVAGALLCSLAFLGPGASGINTSTLLSTGRPLPSQRPLLSFILTQGQRKLCPVLPRTGPKKGMVTAAILLRFCEESMKLVDTETCYLRKTELHHDFH